MIHEEFTAGATNSWVRKSFINTESGTAAFVGIPIEISCLHEKSRNDDHDMFLNKEENWANLESEKIWNKMEIILVMCE